MQVQSLALVTELKHLALPCAAVCIANAAQIWCCCVCGLAWGSNMLPCATGVVIKRKKMQLFKNVQQRSLVAQQVKDLVLSVQWLEPLL